LNGSACTDFGTGCYSANSSNAAKVKIYLGSTQTGLIADTATMAANYHTSSATYTSAPYSTAPTTAAFRIGITPDVAGSYTVLVSTSAGNTATAFTAGDANASYSFSTGNAIAAMALSAVTGTSGTDATNGQLMKLTLTDSAGVATSPKATDTISISGSSSTDYLQKLSVSNQVHTATTTNSATVNTALSLSSSDFVNGVAYFTYKNSAAQTAEIITATGGGSLAGISTTITGVVSSTATGTLIAGSAVTLSDGTATRPGSGQTAYTAGTPGTVTVATTDSSHTVTLTATVTEDTKFDVKVTDTSGKVTGVAGQVYNVVAAITYDSTATSQTTSITLTPSLSTAGQSIRADVTTSNGTGATANDGVIFTSEATTATYAAPMSATCSTTQTRTVYATHGSSSSLWWKVCDQFGAAVANQAVTVATAGRNVTASAALASSDSSGIVTYTRTDAGTSATSNTTDTVTLTAGSGSGVVTINYGADKVSTITCLTGNEDDTSNLKTYRDINAGATGTQAGAASLCTVTVKDANGAVLVGVPVTTTTSSAGAAVVTTSATLYTGSAGTVAPSVYGWTSGSKTFTVTAGGKTATVTVNYEQRSATDVRTISASTSGNVITVTAKDRFGNLVPGVRLYATRTGDATFGGGSTVANAITAGNTSGTTPVPSDLGTAQFVINPGSSASTVTIRLASAADTPDAEYGQSSSTSGKVCAGAGCTDTAVTAETVGTAYTAETGVGASLAPAGINSVTVNVAAGVNAAQVAADAATDAANEAIDAANAATDAANLAAEAADAATVAAEEARDAADAATAAVEELATQVATLMAALKAQITTLANTVAKIAKKVKA